MFVTDCSQLLIDDLKHSIFFSEPKTLTISLTAIPYYFYPGGAEVKVNGKEVLVRS